jgi:hypothetical protein
MHTFKIFLSILIYSCIIFGAVNSIGVNYFLDFPSAIFVLGIATSSMISNSSTSSKAVLAFSKGAVLGGWIGALIGLITVMTHSSFDQMPPPLSWIDNGPALAGALTIVLYGYLVKGLCFLIISGLRRDD